MVQIVDQLVVLLAEKKGVENLDVLADDLVFVDEMGVLLGLMRGMGRSKKGDRVYDVKP